MKKIIGIKALLITSALFIALAGCTKTKEETDCKTCRAFATQSQPEASQEVCSDAAEQSFRSQYSGREISCQ